MFYKKTNFLTLTVIGLIGGCGGESAGTGNLTPASGSIFVSGAYRTVNFCDKGSQGTLIDGNDNLYHVCGTKMSVGRLSGKVTSPSTGTGSVQFRVFDSGAPVSTITIPFPSGPVEVPVPAGHPTVSTSAVLSGTLLLNNGRVDNFMFTDVASPSYTVSFNSRWEGVAPPGSIMASYSTMSGSYLSYRPEKLASDPSETLSITHGGAISGITRTGKITGQISRFNAGTGVHDVNITLTPEGGQPVMMTGVIGPYDVNMTGSTGYAQYSGLLLAVSEGASGFYRIFRRN